MIKCYIKGNTTNFGTLLAIASLEAFTGKSTIILQREEVVIKNVESIEAKTKNLTYVDFEDETEGVEVVYTKLKEFYPEFTESLELGLDICRTEVIKYNDGVFTLLSILNRLTKESTDFEMFKSCYEVLVNHCVEELRDRCGLNV